MESLRVVAVGLAVVWLDLPPQGRDLLADPLGWLLVILGLSNLARERVDGLTGLRVVAWPCVAVSALAWSPESVLRIDPVLEWLVSLPALAFCYLLVDGLLDGAPDAALGRLRLLRAGVAAVALAPLLEYVAEWTWVAAPTDVIRFATLGGLVVVLWSLAEAYEVSGGETASRTDAAQPGAARTDAAQSGRT